MVSPSDKTDITVSALPAILVIDDERGPRESLRILLKPEYQVLCADSVDAGLVLLKEHRPDAVIMDIRMPDKNGIEGLSAIREIDTVVAVIMLTGFGALETAQEAIRRGANDYVKKPFDAFELRKVIQQHVQRTQRDRRRREAGDELIRMNQMLRKELEHRIHLASLGQKSAELVHDLRNPLTVILGYVDLLADEIKRQGNEPGSHDKGETSSYLENIEKNVLRCRDLAEMWLDTSRGKLRRSSVDLGRLVEFIAQECGKMPGKETVAIQIDRTGLGLMADVDKVQLERAVQNLVTNSLEAVAPDNGKVHVWCSPSGSNVEIGVEDNGCGMDAAQIQRTSEPFYTTKKDSGGTGLGLFIVRQVAESHDGALRIESTPGTGTRITLTVPQRPG